MGRFVGVLVVVSIGPEQACRGVAVRSAVCVRVGGRSGDHTPDDPGGFRPWWCLARAQMIVYVRQVA